MEPFAWAKAGTGGNNNNASRTLRMSHEMRQDEAVQNMNVCLLERGRQTAGMKEMRGDEECILSVRRRKSTAETLG